MIYPPANISRQFWAQSWIYLFCRIAFNCRVGEEELSGAASWSSYSRPSFIPCRTWLNVWFPGDGSPWSLARSPESEWSLDNESSEESAWCPRGVWPGDAIDSVLPCSVVICEDRLTGRRCLDLWSIKKRMSSSLPGKHRLIIKRRQWISGRKK